MAGKSTVRRVARPSHPLGVTNVAGVATPRRVRAGVKAVLDRVQEQHDAAAMEEQLTAGFADAVQAAIRAGHARDLAVSGYDKGIAIEVLPDGTRRPLDESAPWSPAGWKRS